MKDHRPVTVGRIAVAPLLIWLVPQLLALIVGVSRVSLWARYPQPGESMSLRLLLTTQIAIASLLFPILLHDCQSIIVVITSSWPLALIAGSLSATQIGTTIGAELFVTGWLVALACVNMNLVSPRASSVGVAFASLWTLGGPVLLYLRYEFADPRPALSGWLAGPIVAIQRHLSGESGLLVPILCFAAIALCGIVPKLRRKALSPLRP